MVFVIGALLTVLLICDIVLITYCKVKNGFRMFAFRFFVVLLAVLSLMLTGDIQIASRTELNDIPAYTNNH